MSKRNFPDFVSAYMQYANDGYAPESFHLWSCLSMIAGVLERKVWIERHESLVHYPNIYVLLVSNPGVGKSSALNASLGLMGELNNKVQSLNLVSQQITQSGFVEYMANGLKPFTEKVGEKELIRMQSAGYYAASEASDSLQNIFGDFIASLTNFYDCPDEFSRTTKKDGTIRVQNACFNMIAGSTFDYLSKLITDSNIMGGFASRLTYIIHRGKLFRSLKFRRVSTESGERREYRRALLEDLESIYSLAGPMQTDPDFDTGWENWYKMYEEERQSQESEKMQTLLVRGSNLALKLSIILSAAQSDDKVIKLPHFNQAIDLVTSAYAEIPGMLREVRANQMDGYDALQQAVFRYFELVDEVTMEELTRVLFLRGFDNKKINERLKDMLQNKVIQLVRVHPDKPSVVKLIVNMNNHL